MVSAHTLALDRNSEELVILDAQDFPIQRYWYLAYPKDKQLSVVAQTFLEFLHKDGRQIGEKYLQGIPGFPAVNQKRT